MLAEPSIGLVHHPVLGPPVAWLAKNNRGGIDLVEYLKERFAQHRSAWDERALVAVARRDGSEVAREFLSTVLLKGETEQTPGDRDVPGERTPAGVPPDSGPMMQPPRGELEEQGAEEKSADGAAVESYFAAARALGSMGDQESLLKTLRYRVRGKGLDYVQPKPRRMAALEGLAYLNGGSEAARRLKRFINVFPEPDMKRAGAEALLTHARRHTAQKTVVSKEVNDEHGR